MPEAESGGAGQVREFRFFMNFSTRIENSYLLVKSFWVVPATFQQYQIDPRASAVAGSYLTQNFWFY